MTEHCNDWEDLRSDCFFGWSFEVQHMAAQHMGWLSKALDTGLLIKVKTTRKGYSAIVRDGQPLRGARLDAEYRQTVALESPSDDRRSDVAKRPRSTARTIMT